MKQMKFGPDHLFNLYQDLQMLKPFLIGSKPLAHTVNHLAEFICKSLPVCRVALVRLGKQKNIKDHGFWSNGPDNLHDLYHQFLEEQLPFLTSSFVRGYVLDDSSLEDLITVTLNRKLDYYPTVFPITHEGKLVGFCFFGKSKAQGTWTDIEKNILTMLLTVISISFSNQNYHDDYALQSWILNATMDSMRINLYITDIKTDTILFMNKTMKQTFGLQNPEGQICWQTLQTGMQHRCDFCPVHILQQSKEENPSYVWEENNTKTGRIYKNYDSLMQWIDGSVVHFQQSVDITDTKMLIQMANIDELTAMLNRRAGKKALQETLEQARQQQLPVTICMYDINILKEINDHYGHNEGDFIITSIASMVKQHLGPHDYPFRLYSDEFILVFWDCQEAKAAQIMARIRKGLEENIELKQKPYEIGFCCGILEIPPDMILNLAEVLTLVDEKMYQQKRQLHIVKAEKARLSQHNQQISSQTFTYNQEYLYDALVQSTDDYIYVCNMQTGTFQYTPAMVEEFGLPGEIVQNAAAVWGAKIHEHDKQAFLESNQEITDNRTNHHCVEYRAQNRKGEWIWLRCRGYLERDEKGEPRLFAGFITNLGKKNKIDHVTGLFNKFEFEETVTHLLQEHPQKRLGIMVLGLDEFRHINDLYDRAFGDEVIRITSQKIQTLLFPGAMVFRLDGDEFGIVASNSGPQEMENFYAILHKTFSQQQEYNGKKYYCTLSGGCAFYPADANHYLDLFKYAGYSLEYAKNMGKNQVVFFSHEILAHKARLLEMTELLRESVANQFQNFTLYYQPQVYAATGKLKGAEALARWHCETYGSIGPNEFIPLLEESGLIHAVGKWIFKQAVDTCAHWVEKMPDFTMSINLSYLQLTQEDFIPFMQKTLAEKHLQPRHIIVELTESCIASSIDMLADTFKKIRSLGIQIAMDDFGTGYSSLDILKNCPADIVKIDRAFVKDIQTSSFDATFIKFIVELCHNVQITVCLEGVENENEYQFVKTMGPDFIQGYYFGHPQPAQDFYLLLIANNK